MPDGNLTMNTSNTGSQSNKREIFLQGSILGPPDTPYAGARFHVDIIVVGNQIWSFDLLFFFASSSLIFRYVSIQSTESSIHNEDLASKCEFSHRCDLLGYFERSMVIMANLSWVYKRVFNSGLQLWLSEQYCWVYKHYYQCQNPMTHKMQVR